MLRNLKVLVVAAIALAAIGAVGVSSAHAEEFHCSVEPCQYTLRSDGTGKTAHQVFIIKDGSGSETVSFTCSQISGQGQPAPNIKTAFWIVFSVSYASCTVNGSSGINVVMNGCDYEFSWLGILSITSCDAGKKVEWKLATGCVFTVGEGGLSVVDFHNLGTTPNRELTVEANRFGIPVTADGTAEQCLIKPNQVLWGDYTTGNMIITGETFGGVMADAWFE